MLIRYSLFPTLAIAFLSLLLASCNKNEQLCNPTHVFDPDLFVQNIEDALTEDEYQAVAGYQFVVNVNGNYYDSRAGGMAVYDSDAGGPVTMTTETETIVASVSKFIGAIALIQVLEKNGIDVNEPIHDYLPAR